MIRARKWLLIISSTFLASLFFLYVFRSVLIAPFIKSAIISNLETALGLSVDIGEIGGNYISNFEIKKFKTARRAELGPIKMLDLESVRLSYSLPTLVDGLDSFLGKAQVELSGGSLELDLTSPPRSSEPPSNGAQKGKGLLPGVLPALAIGDFNIKLMGDGFSINADGLAVETPALGPPTLYRFDIQSLEVNHPKLRSKPVHLATDLFYSGDSVGAANLKIDGDAVVEEVRLNLPEISEGALSFTSALTVFGGRLTLVGRLAGADLSVDLETKGLDLEQAAGFFVLPDAPPIRGLLSGFGDVKINFDHPDNLEGEFTLNLANPGVADIDLEYLSLVASAQKGTALVSLLEGKLGNNILKLQDGFASLEPLFSGDKDRLLAGAGISFLLDFQDIPALLSAVEISSDSQVPLPTAHQLILDGKVHGSKIELGRGSFTASQSRIELKRAKLTAPMAGRSMQDSLIDADLLIDVKSLAQISSLFSLPPLRGSMAGEIVVGGGLNSPVASVKLNGRELFFRETSIGKLTLNARGDAHLADVVDLRLERGSDRVHGSGKVNLDEKSLHGVSFDALIADLGKYADLIPGEPRGRIRATANLDGEFLNPKGDVVLELDHGRIAGIGISRAEIKAFGTGRDFRVESAEIDSSEGFLSFSGVLAQTAEGLDAKIENLDLFRDKVAASLKTPARLLFNLETKRIEMDSLNLVSGDDDLAVKGSVDLGAKAVKGLEVLCSVEKLEKYAEAFFPDSEAKLSGGPINLDVNIDGPLGAPSGGVKISLGKMKIAGFELLSAELRAQASGGDGRIESFSVVTTEGAISLAGKFSRKTADGIDLALERLSLSRKNIELKLKKFASVRYSPESIKVSGLELGGAIGALSIDGVFSRDGDSDLRFGVDDLSSRGWLEEFVGSKISFQGADLAVKLKGPMTNQLARPMVAASGAVEKLTLEGAPFPLEGRFDMTYSAQGVEVRSFEWSGMGKTKISAKGKIPMDPLAEAPFAPDLPDLNVDLNVDISVPNLQTFSSLLPASVPAVGSTAVQLILSGAWPNLQGSAHVRARGLMLPEYIKPSPGGDISIDCDLLLSRDSMQLTLFKISAGKVDSSAKGRWAGAPSLEKLLTDEKPEIGGELSLQGVVSAPDIGWLAKGSESLRRLGGGLEADFKVSGSPSNPTVIGAIRLSNGELRVAGPVPPLQGISLEAIIDRNSAWISELKGDMGSAPFSLGGTLNLKDPENIIADMFFKGEDILLFRNDGVKLRADVDLSVKGSVNALDISGNAAITDGRFVKSFDFTEFLKGNKKPSTGNGGISLFSFPDPPLRDAKLNIRVGSKNPFKIKNNLANGGLRPELVLKGTGEIPLLSGEIYLDPIRINLPAGRLVVESGVIRFLESDPDRPRLDLSAATRMMGYDVSMHVSGPYDAPVVSLSSVPPLPNEELLLMVLTGKPPETPMDQTRARQSGLAVATYLGKGLLSGLMGAESTESGESLADRFDLQIGQGVTKKGQETLEASFLLMENAPPKKGELYIRGEKDVYDAYNAGVRVVFKFK